MTTFVEYLLFMAAILAAIPIIALFLILTNFSALWRFAKSAQRNAARGITAVGAIVGSSIGLSAFVWGADLVDFIVRAEKAAGSRTFILLFAPVCIFPVACVTALVASIVKSEFGRNWESVRLALLTVPSIAAAAFWVRTAFYGFDEARMMFYSILVVAASLLVPIVVFVSPALVAYLMQRQANRRLAEARAAQHPAMLWLRADGERQSSK